MNSRLPVFRATALALGLAAVLASCRGHDDATTLLQQNVVASAGGTFSTSAQEVSVEVPAGALSGDAVLTVNRVPDTALPAAAAAIASTDFKSDAYSVTFTGPGGAAITLDPTKPIKLIMRSSALPTHPTLGEIARVQGNGWLRLGSSFYRNSSQRAVALVPAASGTYRVAFRTLQRSSGADVALGQAVFNDETFGNEAFFGGVLGLHTLLNGISPVAAVNLGVQVDINKVPAGIVAVMTGSDLAAKDAALANPATTKALLQANAVIGVRAQFDGAGNMTSAGLTCALCHVNVTPTTFQLSAGPAALPIGQPRFDGVPNARMNSGAILAATPFVQGLPDAGATAAVLNGWGAGNFDVRSLPDNPMEDNVVNPTNYPPLWNFVDLEEQSYLFGWDGLFANSPGNTNALASQAEAVYDLVMHANGAFGTGLGSLTPALNPAVPLGTLPTALTNAETNQPGNDIAANKLLQVQTFMRSITSPAPGAYNEALAEQGFMLFNGKGTCTSCHRTADFTGPGLITAVSNPQGALAGGIKIPSLRGVSHTAPYLSNGSVGTLSGAVDGVLGALGITMTGDEKAALVEYLKSL